MMRPATPWVNQSTSLPPEIREVENEIRKVRTEKEAVIKAQEFEKAAQIRDREEKLRARKQQMEEEWREKRNVKGTPTNTVGPEEIAHIVSTWTRIPVSKLKEEETMKLLNMEEALHKRIVGQDFADEFVRRKARGGLLQEVGRGHVHDFGRVFRGDLK